MQKPFDLLEGVLNEIENSLKDNINEISLASKFSLSQVHLRRLFKFAFGKTLGAYIRSRKMAASINDLLHTDRKLLDIALDYGIDYEHSYIRTFKNEFGITPGDLRKRGHVIKITPPLQLFDSNKLEDGILFGPDIVVIPEFHVAGKRLRFLMRDVFDITSHIKDQYFNKRFSIPNAVNPEELLVFCRRYGEYLEYLMSMQVTDLDNIPRGFDYETFPTSLYARFRFLGSDNTMNSLIASGMNKAIDDFMDNNQQKYFLKRTYTWDKFSPALDGNFIQREWFSPIEEKSKYSDPNTYDGIIKTYKLKVPALRFIGKKYSEPVKDFSWEKFLNKLDEWCWNHMFEPIEMQLKKDIKKLYEGADAYIGLINKKDDKIEYMLGMFTPAGTAVPPGYESADFPKSTLAVAAVHGKKYSIINFDDKCKNRLTKEGVLTSNAQNGNRFFLRFSWPHFFGEDGYRKRVLEYCYFL